MPSPRATCSGWVGTPVPIPTPAGPTTRLSVGTPGWVGLLILFEGQPDDGPGVDLRVGYLLGASVWGEGMATELVAGLVTWARAQPSIATLTAGVEATNPASARVLSKNDFARVGSAPEGELRDPGRHDGRWPDRSVR